MIVLNNLLDYAQVTCKCCVDKAQNSKSGFRINRATFSSARFHASL